MGHDRDECMRVAVITVSDRASVGERDDLTGPAVVARIEADGHDIALTRIIADGETSVRDVIHAVAPHCDVLILAGGTGLGPRDRTPEGVRAACDRDVPGIGEAIRAASRAHVPTVDLSRACGALCGTCLVIAVPGSPGGATDAWAAVRGIVPHAISTLHGAGHGP